MHQAAGLMGLNQGQFPRLTAFVSHGDPQSELPLLWKLCSAIVDMGHSVTVLDGTTPETGENPGLEQVLDFTAWREVEPDAHAWNILPSMHGLHALTTFSNPATRCLSELGRAFAHDGIVIMYSNAQRMSTLLASSGVRPLLSISPAKTSLLTSYLALKRLLIKGRLEPAVANVVQYQDSGLETSETVANNLRDCAKYFLDFDVNILPIVTPSGEDRPGMDVQRVALSMIENAIPLDTGWTTPSLRADVPAATRAARSH